MSLLAKTGLLLMIIASLMALYSSNLFGYAQRVREQISSLKIKEKNGLLTKTEYEELRYFKLNKFVTMLCMPLLGLGLILFIVGMLTK